jgi:hypothetical protein
MQTDRRLWLIFSTLTFVLLGFVSMHSEGVEDKIGPTSFWGSVTRPPIGWGWQMPLMIGFYALITAVPAATFGWVAQAVFVALKTARSAGQEAKPTS